MCGIVGYYGNSEKTLTNLLNGLKRLEYRGYDSSGIAVIEEMGTVYYQKSVGLISNLEQILSKDEYKPLAKVGIAHTRWATHGVPTVENAHPHHSSDKKFWVVHNGIIENYKQLRAGLENSGIAFYSETDTEIIAKLLQINYQNDLKKAVLETLRELQGAYAIAVICEHEPDRLIGAKKGSPLVLGIGKDDFVLASDVSAIINITKEVIYLEDGELIDIKDNNFEITNFQNQVLNKKADQIEWSEEEATKEGYSTFMEKEIAEQSKIIKNSYLGRLHSETGNVKFGGLLDFTDKIRQSDKVITLGIGSSYFAAKLGELYFEKLAKITSKAEMSPEFRYKDSVINQNTWIISISQSGETADTIAAINEAKNKNALVTGIVNTVGSTISRLTDAGVYNHIGPEISVASTKATTSQYLLLLMHAIYLGRMRDLSITTAKHIIEEIQRLPAYFNQVIESWSEISKIAQKYSNAKSCVFLGRNLNYPIAQEGAIKLKEISYIHAEAFSGGELKHGPLALIDEEVPSVVICPTDSVYEKQLGTIAEIKARKGPVIALTTIDNIEVADLVDDVIYVPKAENEEIQPIINVLALQILACETAKSRNLDIDKPRNLAKSVTVE